MSFSSVFEGFSPEDVEEVLSLRGDLAQAVFGIICEVDPCEVKRRFGVYVPLSIRITKYLRELPPLSRWWVEGPVLKGKDVIRHVVYLSLIHEPLDKVWVHHYAGEISEKIWDYLRGCSKERREYLFCHWCLSGPVIDLRATLSEGEGV